MSSQARRKLQRCWPAGKIFQEVMKFRLKNWIGFGGFVDALKLEQRNHQSFRNVASAVRPETAGNGSGDSQLRGHETTIVAHEGRRAKRQKNKAKITQRTKSSEHRGRGG